MSVSYKIDARDQSGSSNSNSNAIWLVLATSVVSVAASFSCFYLMMKTNVFFDNSDGEHQHHQQQRASAGANTSSDGSSNKNSSKSMADTIEEEGSSNHLILDQLHLALKYEVDDEFKDMKDGHGNVVKGAKVKMLSNNPDGSERFVLQLELGPDAFYPPHLHGSAEFCFLVRGQMIDNFGLKTAPCYMYNAPNSKHFNIYAGPEGCTILVVK